MPEVHNATFFFKKKGERASQANHQQVLTLAVCGLSTIYFIRLSIEIISEMNRFVNYSMIVV